MWAMCLAGTLAIWRKLQSGEAPDPMGSHPVTTWVLVLHGHYGEQSINEWLFQHGLEKWQILGGHRVQRLWCVIQLFSDQLRTLCIAVGWLGQLVDGATGVAHIIVDDYCTSCTSWAVTVFHAVHQILMPSIHLAQWQLSCATALVFQVKSCLLHTLSHELQTCLLVHRMILVV